jgi:hypothetical protein
METEITFVLSSTGTDPTEMRSTGRVEGSAICNVYEKASSFHIYLVVP